MKHRRPIQFAWWLTVAAALALVSCGQKESTQESSTPTTATTENNQGSETSPAQPAQPEAATKTVVGTLTGEGTECPALRADDGTLYTLVGDLGTAATGDHVRVTGTATEVSTCMQGTTLRVVSIEKAP